MERDLTKNLTTGPTPTQEILDHCLATDSVFSPLPWSPLAGGFLSGKYNRGGTAPAGTRAGSEKPLYQWISEEYAQSDRNWATIDAVVRIAKEIGATLPIWSLWRRPARSLVAGWHASSHAALHRQL